MAWGRPSTARATTYSVTAALLATAGAAALTTTTALLTTPLAAQSTSTNGDVGHVRGTVAANRVEELGRPGGSTPLALPRLEGPLQLDGHLDEEAWERVEPLPLVMLWPTFRGQMTEHTEIRVGYDDEAVWAAARFHDRDPAAIRASTLHRDRWQGDDAFSLVIDAFNDDRTALRFTVFPRGALMDQAIRNDAEPSAGIQIMNMDWDGFWEARTRITDDGWYAEVRIPFSTLRFQPDSDGRVVMGLIASRYISRRNEKQIFPFIPPDWQVPDFKPSQARDISLERVARRRLVEITPYALTGARQRVRGGVGLTADGTGEVGGDVKVGLASNLTLDLTVNTDFAQVESDALQLNLTRFNLFFPEKRDFFQERASVFQFAMSDEALLFHSRRIGLGSDGVPLRILGGARMTGRMGAWDVGALDLQVDAGEGPGSVNTGAARIQRAFDNGASTAGAMVTSRVPTAGTARVDGGADAHLYLGGDDFLTMQWAGSWAEGSTLDPVADGLSRVMLERRSGRGFSGYLDLARAGAGFDPALGYLQRRDYTAAKGSVSHTWRPDRASFNWHRAITTSRLYLRNHDRSVQSALQRFRWQGSTASGHFLNAALNLEYEHLAQPLDLLDQATVPPGRYFGPNLFLFGASNGGRDLSASVIAHGGTFFDGWQGRLSFEPTWRPSPHFSTSLDLRLTRLVFPDRDEHVQADVARLRVDVAADIHLSAQAFLQYERATGRYAADARLRYRFSEGRDLYLVVTETAAPGGLVDGATVPSEGRRRVLLKYAHTFRP